MHSMQLECLDCIFQNQSRLAGGITDESHAHEVGALVEQFQNNIYEK